MNQTQIKYIVKRLEEEYARKSQKIQERYPHYISDDEYARVINENKLPLKYTLTELRELCTESPNMKILGLFDTSQYITSYKEREKQRNAAYAVLRTRVDNIKDNIMLGDAKDALDQLNAFIKEEF